MEPRFLQFNFANFITINLMVIAWVAVIMLALRLMKRGAPVAVPDGSQ